MNYFVGCPDQRAAAAAWLDRSRYSQRTCCWLRLITTGRPIPSTDWVFIIFVAVVALSIKVGVWFINALWHICWNIFTVNMLQFLSPWDHVNRTEHYIALRILDLSLGDGTFFLQSKDQFLHSPNDVTNPPPPCVGQFSFHRALPVTKELFLGPACDGLPSYCARRKGIRRQHRPLGEWKKKKPDANAMANRGWSQKWAIIAFCYTGYTT